MTVTRVALPCETLLPLLAVNRLAGKIALITGAADGLGREIAGAFAAEGAAVPMVDCAAAPLAAAAGRLAAAGRRVLPLTCDVGDTAQMEKAVTATLTAFGRIDILVNTAGIAVAGDITGQGRHGRLGTGRFTALR